MLRNLKSNQVDLNARTMRLEAGTTKNGKARVVKIDGELLETIEAQWQGRMVAQFLGLSFVFHRDGENRSGITQCVG
ncbi:MAG TPA: hypothetical protein VF452_06460 [Candidatus Binatia bacterium]